MKLDEDKYVQIRLTETVTYRLVYTIDELAELLGVEPTAEAVGAVLDPDNNTYGVKGDDWPPNRRGALLAAVLAGAAEVAVGERYWDFFQTLRP